MAIMQKNWQGLHITVNVLKSQTLSVLKLDVGHQGWNFQNACKNSKREDPDQSAS